MPDLWPARRGSAPARPRLTRHVLHLERGNRVKGLTPEGTARQLRLVPYGDADPLT